MWEGWLNLAGIEVVNSSRAAAGAQAHGLPVVCGPCPGLHRTLGEAPYTGTPQTDDAPWWDRTRPESGRFLGVMGLKVQGFAADPVERTTVPLIGDGSARGYLRRGQRDLVYTVALLALDDEALAYGYEWLASVLRGDTCGTCAGSDLCVLAACPPEDTEGDAQLRHLYDVGLLDGVAEQERAYLGGGGQCDEANAACCTVSYGKPVYARATFTLFAALPYIYREPILVRGGEWTDLTKGDLLPNYDPEAAAADCPEPTSCLTDPHCPAPPLPPQPPVPANPCWPTSPFTARRSWLTVDPRNMPQWGQTVPVIELYTGSTALTRVIIRFYPNPAGLDCASAGADPCAACTDVGMAYLPARAELVLDGRTETASVDCSGGSGMAASSPDLYGRKGAQFGWPVFDCASGLCIEVITVAADTTDGAAIRVSLVPRSDAG